MEHPSWHAWQSQLGVNRAYDSTAVFRSWIQLDPFLSHQPIICTNFSILIFNFDQNPAFWSQSTPTASWFESFISLVDSSNNHFPFHKHIYSHQRYVCVRGYLWALCYFAVTAWALGLQWKHPTLAWVQCRSTHYAIETGQQYLAVHLHMRWLWATARNKDDSARKQPELARTTTRLRGV